MPNKADQITRMLETPKPPKLPKLLILAASVGAFAASAGGIAVSIFGTPHILWASLGFTIIALIAAVIGVMAGMGRFAVGYGMAALCVGGTIAVATGFAMLDLRSNLGSNASLSRLVMPWVGMQLLCAVTVVAGGGAAVLSRRPSSWRLIARGLVFLAAAGLLLAGAWVGLGFAPENENGRVITLGVLLFGGAIIGILVSIGGHLLIRAFEITSEEPGE